MDIKEFSAKLAEATKELSLEERQALMKMFASVSDEVKKDDVVTEILVSDEGTEIPNGITKRLQALKDNYLEQVPSITIVPERLQKLPRKIQACQRLFCGQNASVIAVKQRRW